MDASDFDWGIQFTIFRFTSALSIFGSIWILAEILSDERKRSMCFHRIIFALSSFNLLSSIWFFIGVWAQPNSDDKDLFTDLGYSRSRHGTTATCSMSGYSIYLASLAIPWYNAALAIYFYLVGCCRWTEEQIRNNFERYLHYIIGPISVMIAIIPFMVNVYHVWYNYCFISAKHSPSGTGIQVTDIFQLFTVIGVGISSCIIGIVIILMLRPGRKNISTNSRTSIIISGLYSTVFIISWVVPIFYMLTVQLSFRKNSDLGAAQHNFRVIFIVQLYLSIFLPLQGFLNWILYLRPRFNNFRGKETTVSSYVLIKDTLFWSCLQSKNEEYDGDCYLGSFMNTLEKTDDHPVAAEGDIPDLEDIEVCDISQSTISRPISLTTVVKKSNNDDVISEVTFDYPIIQVDGVNIPMNGANNKRWPMHREPIDELASIVDRQSGKKMKHKPYLKDMHNRYRSERIDKLLYKMEASTNSDPKDDPKPEKIKHVKYHYKSSPKLLDVPGENMLPHLKLNWEPTGPKPHDDQDEERELAALRKSLNLLQINNGASLLRANNGERNTNKVMKHESHVKNMHKSGPKILDLSQKKVVYQSEPLDTSSDAESSYDIELQGIAAALSAKW